MPLDMPSAPPRLRVPETPEPQLYIRENAHGALWLAMVAKPGAPEQVVSYTTERRGEGLWVWNPAQSWVPRCRSTYGSARAALEALKRQILAGVRS